MDFIGDLYIVKERHLINTHTYATRKKQHDLPGVLSKRKESGI